MHKRGARMRFLIVDDSKIIRILLEQAILYSGKHEFIHASYGEVALKIIKKDPSINVLILDNNMLGMSGLECLKAIRRDPQFDALEIVMCTSEKSKDKITEYITSGANIHLQKPFTKDTVIQTLNLKKR